MCSAIQGNGKKTDKAITSGVEWLLDTVKDTMGKLEERVRKDTEDQDRIRAKGREERKARVMETRDNRYFIKTECSFPGSKVTIAYIKLL